MDNADTLTMDGTKAQLRELAAAVQGRLAAAPAPVQDAVVVAHTATRDTLEAMGIGLDVLDADTLYAMVCAVDLFAALAHGHPSGVLFANLVVADLLTSRWAEVAE